MSIPQIVEVAIAMAVVYYLLGLVVSFFTGRINEFFETRGSVLQDYIKKIVGQAEGKDTVGDFYKLPQLESLKSIRYDGFWGAILRKTKINDKIESIPVTNLVDAFFDFCKIGNEKKKYTPKELLKLANALPDSEGKNKLISIINNGVTEVDELRTKISMWFGGLMDQVAMQYKAYTRYVVILLSVLVTVAFAVDSIDLARQFWDNAAVLSIATAKATAIVEKQPTADLVTLSAELKDLKIEYGWGQLIASFNEQPAKNQLPWALWKIVGLIISAAAVSQGSSFWYDMLKSWKGGAKPPPEEKEPAQPQPA